MPKILLIEDEPFILDLYVRVLKEAGFEVDSVSDGLQALQKIKDGGHDVVLLDIMLPSMNGVDILKEAHVDIQTHEPKVILLTNLAKDSIIKQGYELGVIGHILKAKILPQQLADAMKYFFETGKLPETISGVFTSPPADDNSSNI